VFASGGWGYPPDPPKEFQVGEPSVAESRLYSAGLGAKARPWCQATGLGAKARDKMVLQFRVSILDS
jgi:hypothetical protein